MKLRIKFAKRGAMKFVGHLDMMRYFQKAIRRAGIDIAYSGGFSPHQIMSFAAPLGVGLESIGEYFDIEVNTSKDDCEKEGYTQELTRRLNAVMAEGINIIRVTVLPENAGNAMASVRAAKYEVRFRKWYEPLFDWKSQLPLFYNQLTIPVIKKTKKSEAELDIKASIYQLEESEDRILMLVDASSSGNIKPTLVMEAFFKFCEQTLGEFDLEITRLETYAAGMVPLDKETLP